MHPFVSSVSTLKFENCFNPYTDRCEIHDQHDAPHLRALALSALIEQASQEKVDSLWIGRDLGYRGGRRTGLALTDDVNVEKHFKRWGINSKPLVIGEVIAERTAAVIWRMLDQIDAKIFLWNVFPLHPHESGEPFTNRQHNARERRAGEEVLKSLVHLLKPSRVIAIGNDAAAAADRIVQSAQVVRVRHPSYGGQTQFERQISDLYSIQESAETLPLF